MSTTSSSHTPITPEAIAQLQSDLLATKQQLDYANQQGRAYQKEYEKLKSRNINEKLPSYPTPTPFDGTNTSYGVDSYLRSMQRMFTFYGPNTFPDDMTKLNRAIVYLSGPVIDWWENLPNNERDIIVTWDMFEEKLRSRFRPVQDEVQSKIALFNLKQTGTVQAYITEYQRLSIPIKGRSVDDHIIFFMNGLKQHIKDEVNRKPLKSYVTLNDIIEAAVQAEMYAPKSNHSNRYHGGGNNHMYSNWNSNRNSHSHASTSAPMDISNVNNIMAENPNTTVSNGQSDGKTYMPNHSTSPNTYGHIGNTNNMNADIVSMLLNAIQNGQRNQYGNRYGDRPPFRVPGVSREEVERCITNGLCILCKKPGHTARYCSAKSLKA